MVQFSEPAAYNESILRAVNNACKRFGAKINVRFWGHYGSKFDCRHLRQLPEVRSLNLDCLAGITNTDELIQLLHLEEFVFGVFESDLPQLLETASFVNLRKLVLAKSRKNNIDLAPLAGYGRLEELFLNAQALHIEVLSGLHRVRSLWLSGMGNKQPLGFVGGMNGLRSLTLLLGGREGLGELAHDEIKHLEVLRVRGLLELDLRLFPSVENLRVEDQLQLRALNVESSSHLRWLSIWNCKNLSRLPGIESAEQIEYLFLGKVALKPDEFLTALPTGLQRLSLSGYGRKRDEDLKKRAVSLGYAPARYMEAVDSTQASVPA